MQLGLIGLGRMGFNMRERLRAAGHEVIGYDRHPDVTDVASLNELVEKLAAPRVVWIMVPVQFTEPTIDELSGLLASGDVVIDGGNSRFSNDKPRAEKLAAKGIGYLDVGVSGGIWGRTNGYALMVGGEKEYVEHCMPIFDGLKPAGEFGFAHAGGPGAGHYAKMVHNGIEYGMMQAYAEGFQVLEKSEYPLDLPQVGKIWQHGSVVRSWLLDLAVSAFEKDPKLDNLEGWVDDSGEGRWTIEAAIDEDVPAPVITMSLFSRFYSRDRNSFSWRVLAALRNEFGGHAVRVDGQETGVRSAPVGS